MDNQGLIDLTDTPLEELWNLADEDDSVLKHMVLRVTEGAKDQVCAFNSAV